MTLENGSEIARSCDTANVTQKGKMANQYGWAYRMNFLARFGV